MIENKTYFTLKKEEEEGKNFIYHLEVDSPSLPFNCAAGSYNVFVARIMQLSYPDYLRMCRDMLGAEIRGKGVLYSYPIFTMNSETLQFVKLLNKRVNIMLWDREHPELLDKIKE